MTVAGYDVSRLSEGGNGGLGLSCTEDGLFLGRTPLIERRGERYLIRPQHDLERLLNRAYPTGMTLDRVIRGLIVVASALSWEGEFDYWPEEGCEAVLARIEREWIRANADPNLAEPICWFAPRLT